MDEWMDGTLEQQMDRQYDGWMDGTLDGQIE